MPSDFNFKRVRSVKKGADKNGPIIYWMQRDQRADDNWALIYAQKLAIESGRPLLVVFSLSPNFIESPIRHYAFMLKGLKETETKLHELNIPFYLLLGEPHLSIPDFIETTNASVLIMDFNPLRLVTLWKNEILQNTDIAIYEVDAHNIVPCWTASPKLEYSARTIRTKIHKALPEFLTGFPPLSPVQKNSDFLITDFDYDEVLDTLHINRSVEEALWIKPGSAAGMLALYNFISNKLPDYKDKRNDPNSSVQSELSPYFHFGQIAPQRAVLELQRLAPVALPSIEAFMEELIIRRELSDNFCFYNDEYDNIKGIPKWALESLNKHRKDEREHVYGIDAFENAATHDPLWNAAQMEAVKTGKMRGYMRMYWAKKILEWTASPEDAFRIAVYLNDKYNLDGRDPNGYAGISWSLGGTHDRPWFEREIFGQIRYMNYEGCRRKFDVQKYIERISSI
jgi:deoxyribodipyrimidine photo-lyase